MTILFALNFEEKTNKWGGGGGSRKTTSKLDFSNHEESNRVCNVQRVLENIETHLILGIRVKKWRRIF